MCNFKVEMSRSYFWGIFVFYFAFNQHPFNSIWFVSSHAKTKWNIRILLSRIKSPGKEQQLENAYVWLSEFVGLFVFPEQELHYPLTKCFSASSLCYKRPFRSNVQRNKCSWRMTCWKINTEAVLQNMNAKKRIFIFQVTLYNSIKIYNAIYSGRSSLYNASF